MRKDPAITAVGSPGERPLLIVNADDFGLTPGVCRGVLTAHERGIVTSTSALAVAPAFGAYAGALRDSGLPVGGHLAAVGEDPPLLSAREVPTLVTAGGGFPLTWQEFVRRVARGAVDPADLRREFSAQLDRLHGVGLRLTHLDSHQNLHLWPTVSSVLFDLAAQHGIGAIRLSRSARWTPTAVGVRTLSALLARRAAAAGLSFPAASTGLDEVASLDRERLIEAVDRLARSGQRSAELVTHLGEDPDPDRSRYVTRFAWSGELAAVCDPAVGRAVERSGFRLGSFGDLSGGEVTVSLRQPPEPSSAPAAVRPISGERSR